MIEILNIRIVSEEEQDSINRQMLIINDLISRYYANLTANEIKEAMRLYVFKQFPNVKVFRLIDAVSVGEILKSYIEHRNEVVEPHLQKRAKLINAPKEATEEEKKESLEKFVEMVFNEVKEKGFCSDAWYLFKHLEKKGNISVSNEEKEILYKKELAIYVPEERQRIKKQNPMNFKSSLNEFEKSYSNGNRPVYVKNRCRSLLVSEFIKEKINTIEELKFLLE